MTISFVLFLALAAYMCVKMKGAQWYVILIGIMLGKSLTPGSAIDNSVTSAMTALDSGIKSLIETVGGGNIL